MIDQDSTYSFVLVLSGISEPDGQIEDALFEAGCDDATLYFRDQVGYLDFDRVAPDIEHAISSAIQDVEKTKHRVSVLHVEPSDLVSASEIARRLKYTREYVRLLTRGERGRGHFPAPLSGVSSTTLIWSWVEVIRWFNSQNRALDESLLHRAEAIRSINDVLLIRRNPEIETQRLRISRLLHDADTPTLNDV